MEFIAYRILYYIYLQGNKGYTGGNTDMTIILSSLSVDALQVPDVVHALEIRQAVQAENYHRFFMLLDQTPNMGRYILNNMVDEIRLKALQRMAKAYRPSVETNFVVHELGFDDVKKGLSFIKHLGCILSEGDTTTTQDGINSMWNTKDSVIDPAALFTQEKLLL
jgi:hypothetical protein